MTKCFGGCCVFSGCIVLGGCTWCEWVCQTLKTAHDGPLSDDPMLLKLYISDPRTKSHTPNPNPKTPKVRTEGPSSDDQMRLRLGVVHAVKRSDSPGGLSLEFSDTKVFEP